MQAQLALEDERASIRQQRSLEKKARRIASRAIERDFRKSLSLRTLYLLPTKVFVQPPARRNLKVICCDSPPTVVSGFPPAKFSDDSPYPRRERSPPRAPRFVSPANIARAQLARSSRRQQHFARVNASEWHGTPRVGRRAYRREYLLWLNRRRESGRDAPPRCAVVSSAVAQIPTTHAMACTFPHSALWENSIDKELRACTTNVVFGPFLGSSPESILPPSYSVLDGPESIFSCFDLVNSSDDEGDLGNFAEACAYWCEDLTHGHARSSRDGRATANSRDERATAKSHSDDTQASLFMLRTSHSVLAIAGVDADRVLVDGGATIHATSREDLCLDISPCSVSVAGVSGVAFKCLKKGKLAFHSESSSSPIILTDVHISKEFPTTFIS
jgi:hypothetical protein